MIRAMPLFKKKSEFEKDRRNEIKAAKQDAREDRKSARQNARAERIDARQDARAGKKDARQEAKAAKQDARDDKREAMKHIRQSNLRGAEKRDAKKEVRGEKKDAIQVARQEKKDAKHRATGEKKDRISAANQQKKDVLRDVRAEKRAALQALRIPRALDRKWVSYLRFQEVKALEIFKPKNLADLQTICRIATENELKVRAIGSGHSFSAIGVTDDIFVETQQMKSMLPLTPASRRQRFKPEYHDARRHAMAEFEVGRTIIDLSTELEKSGHALVNQGTYDGQTFWGAVSTSTHGSGIERGPFPNMVLSLVLVGEHGRTYRIEPRNGITQPRGWNEPGIDELIQHDDTFNSVVCSFGCMGIVYSAIIALRPFYWLDEWTYITTWDTFKASFANPQELRDFVGQWSTFSMLVAPTKAEHGRKDGVTLKDEYAVSLCLRQETDERRPIGGNFTDRLAKTFEDLHIITGKAPAEGRWWRPKLANLKRDDGWLATSAVRQTGKRGWTGRELDPTKMPIQRRNKCYNIFPKGGKLFGGYGIELAFPIERTFAVMDRIIELAEQNDEDRLFHTAPVAIRFVAKSAAYASPQYNRETVMFEVLMAKGTDKGAEALKLIEEAMLHERDVRLHWGLNMDRLRPDNSNLARMYPCWDRFKRTFERFNRQGTFHNEFTDRIGLSSSA